MDIFLFDDFCQFRPDRVLVNCEKVSVLILIEAYI